MSEEITVSLYIIVILHEVCENKLYIQYIRLIMNNVIHNKMLIRKGWSCMMHV